MTRPTPAQNVARARNWRIRSLRALFAQTYLLDRELGDKARLIVDEQIVRLGAESQIDRMVKREREQLERHQIAAEELPF